MPDLFCSDVFALRPLVEDDDDDDDEAKADADEADDGDNDASNVDTMGDGGMSSVNVFCNRPRNDWPVPIVEWLPSMVNSSGTLTR